VAAFEDNVKSKHKQAVARSMKRELSEIKKEI
jgi:hypothetical protein